MKECLIQDYTKIGVDLAVGPGCYYASTLYSESLSVLWGI